jgi:hypothetical protein
MTRALRRPDCSYGSPLCLTEASVAEGRTPIAQIGSRTRREDAFEFVRTG